ncbi:Uncharacterized protein TCM_016435 [Theobroma cacao]|uniref:Uncharacterized protein n=1 Tax=Theobroma cacao TaxID=3641 RepID=A0A061G721_THECC|nr:Uncharacterized protein TCM_016435 [Theobroma cacao]
MLKIERYPNPRRINIKTRSPYTPRTIYLRNTNSEVQPICITISLNLIRKMRNRVKCSIIITTDRRQQNHQITVNNLPTKHKIPDSADFNHDRFN